MVTFTSCLMNPQTLHVFDVYAGETYSTGTPAHSGLVVDVGLELAEGHRASCDESPFFLRSPLMAYLMPLSLSSTIASLFALAFLDYQRRDSVEGCFTRSFSLLEPANFFSDACHWGVSRRIWSA